MSGRQLQRSSRRGPEEADKGLDHSLEDEVSLKILRTHLPWREWVVRDFLRYWYGLVAFALDVFLPWTVLETFHIRGIGAAAVVGLLVFVLIFFEVVFYLRIWPQGPWGAERRRRRKRFTTPDEGIIERFWRWLLP